MNIDNLIENLNLLKNKVGGDKEIVFVTEDGENDVYSLDYSVAGDFEDCDTNEYSCAFIIDKCGEEFTRKGISHYKWNSREDMIA